MKKIQLLSILLSFFSIQAFGFSNDFLQIDNTHYAYRTYNVYEDNPYLNLTDSLNELEETQNTLSVDVHMRNFNSSSKLKIEKAKKILEFVMNSQEFKTKILNFTWKGKKEFNNNKNMSNLEIYNHLMTGEEDLLPRSTGVMNFDLTLYRSKNPWSKVKGYTTPDSMRIYMNKKFFFRSSWTAIDVAANMAHEWVHKMGFGHDYRFNEDRPFSVPYAVGNIVSQLAKKMGF